MFKTIIEKIDLKWWSSLEAQKQLNIFLISVIIGLLFVSSRLYDSVDYVRKEKDLLLEKERVRTDECNEKRFKMVEKYEVLWYETERLKRQVNTEDK